MILTDEQIKEIVNKLMDDKVMFSLSTGFHGSEITVPFGNVEPTFDQNKFDIEKFNKFMADLYEECQEKPWTYMFISPEKEIEEDLRNLFVKINGKYGLKSYTLPKGHEAQIHEFTKFLINYVNQNTGE